MNKEETVFKGTRDGLLIILAEQNEFKQAMEGLRTKLEAARGFFQGAHVTVDLGDRKITGRQKKALSRLINSQAGLTLKGFTADRDDLEITLPSEQREIDEDELGLNEDISQGSPGRASKLPVMFIDRNLRCGQRVNFNGHVVVIGDVNPGAEIVAHGNVVVIGALRGLVHAGVNEDVQAIVAAFRLEPSQLRIAGVFTRSPDEDTRSHSGRPEIARLRDGNVVVEQGTTLHTLSLVQRG